VDRRKARSVGQIDLGHRDEGAVDADRIEPDTQFTQEMGDTRKRRPQAHIQQSFLEDAYVDHRAAPQGEFEAWIEGRNRSISS